MSPLRTLSHIPLGYRVKQFQKDTALLGIAGLGDRRRFELLQFIGIMNRDLRILFKKRGGGGGGGGVQNYSSSS